MTDSFKYCPILKRKSGEAVFQGYVEIKIPAYKDRIGFIKSMNFSVSQDGKAEISTEKAGAVAERLDEMVKAHIVSIDLKHFTGKSFSVLQDMEPFRFYRDLMSELGDLVLNGIQLGEE